MNCISLSYEHCVKETYLFCFAFTDSDLLLPTLQLVSQNKNTFLIDVVYNNLTVENYNITLVPLFNPLFRVTLNNNSRMRLFNGTDSKYNFTVDFCICSRLGNKHYTLGKL